MSSLKSESASMMASRPALAGMASSAGIVVTLGGCPSSPLNITAFCSIRSTTPEKSSSAPIGI